MELVIIAAVAENGVIGREGDIPWHIPEDLRRFKALTVGHPVIMGRRTYESIVERLGKPLPDRTNIVLSRGEPSVDPDVRVVSGIEAALEAARETGAERAFVVGGATVYERFLPLADRLELTEVHERYDGDTRFPRLERAAWVEVARDDRDGYAFVTYQRRNVGSDR